VKGGRLIALSGMLLLAGGLAWWLRVQAARPILLSSPPPTPIDDLVGRVAPRVVGMTPDPRGKIIVVNFWADWCKPCMAELPRLENEVWKRYRERDLVVLGVGRGMTASSVLAFRNSHPVTFPLLADPGLESSTAFHARDSIPQTYVIDRRGVIVFQTLGYNAASFGQLVEAIEKAL
jgi:peroxiredoxin